MLGYRELFRFVQKANIISWKKESFFQRKCTDDETFFLWKTVFKLFALGSTQKHVVMYSWECEHDIRWQTYIFCNNCQLHIIIVKHCSLSMCKTFRNSLILQTFSSICSKIEINNFLKVLKTQLLDKWGRKYKEYWKSIAISWFNE